MLHAGGQALELQVIENVQRVDVHPLDEAHRHTFAWRSFCSFKQAEERTPKACHYDGSKWISKTWSFIFAAMLRPKTLHNPFH